MAMKYLTNLDLNKNQILNVVVQNLAADPAVDASKNGQIYYNTADKVLKIFNGTSWNAVFADAVLSVNAATGETVIAVDNTDAKNPKLSAKISATQGAGVAVTKESDGLKVSVQDGTTAQKGIVQLVSDVSSTGEDKAVTQKGAFVAVAAETATTGSAYTYKLTQGGTDVAEKIEMKQGTTAVVGMVQLDSTPSATEEGKAATPKGANVTLTKEATATSGSVHTYTLAQGGTNIATKIELVEGTTSAKGLVQLSSTPSATDETTAATPKGANVTLTKQATAESGYAATYVFAQGGTELATKINIPLDYLVKKAEVKVCTVDDQPVEGLEVGDKYIDFTVNAKEGTGTESHMYIPVKDIAKAYTAGDGVTISAENVIAVNAGDGLAINSTSKAVEVAVENGLKIDSTSKKVGIDNTITAQATSAVYPVTLTAQGLVASYGSAVKTAKKTSVAMAATDSTKSVDVSGKEVLDFFVLDASGNLVMMDVAVSSTAVTFSSPAAVGEALTCYVVYQDTALQA